MGQNQGSANNAYDFINFAANGAAFKSLLVKDQTRWSLEGRFFRPAKGWNPWFHSLKGEAPGWRKTRVLGSLNFIQNDTKHRFVPNSLTVSTSIIDLLTVVFYSELYTDSGYSQHLQDTSWKLKPSRDIPNSMQISHHLHDLQENTSTPTSPTSSIDIPPPNLDSKGATSSSKSSCQRNDLLPLACWRILRLQLGWKGVSVKSPTVLLRWNFWKILGGPILDGVTCRDVGHIRGFLEFANSPQQKKCWMV